MCMSRDGTEWLTPKTRCCPDCNHILCENCRYELKPRSSGMLERFRDALGAASTSVLRSSSWDLRSTPNNAIDHGNQGHATVERYEIFDSVLMSAPSTTAKYVSDESQLSHID